METPMAYFLWNDEGIMEFLNEYEPDFIDHFSALPRMVEKSDIFRIMVCKYIGGVVSLSLALFQLGRSRLLIGNNTVWRRRHSTSAVAGDLG